MDFLLPILLGILIVCVVMMFVTSRWQRRGLDVQQSSMDRIDESLELSRRSVELQEEANRLLQAILEKSK